MKKLLILFVAVALLAVAVKADVQPFGGAGWASCNTTGNYGGHANDCFVAWDGVTQACDETNSDATFTVGTVGMTTTNIVIDHLNGISDNDGFEVKDGSTVLCTVDDVAADSENWALFDCNVNLQGVQTLTLHPTAAAWSDCATWGQVAVKGITFDAAPTTAIDFGACPIGWGVPAISGGTYGGVSYNDFCLVWEPTCADGTNTASVAMTFAGGDEVLTITHLDGMSNLDSFDVIVGGVLVGSYDDSLNSSEEWVTTDFPVNIAAGVYRVNIKVTDAAWDQCASWGQLAIDSIVVGSSDNTVPEFGLIAGAAALIGLIAGVTVLRKRQ